MDGTDPLDLSESIRRQACIVVVALDRIGSGAIGSGVACYL